MNSVELADRVPPVHRTPESTRSGGHVVLSTAPYLRKLAACAAWHVRFTPESGHVQCS
jgi:hypothetical protein